ncbi:hypothetical protein B0H13DRAFT_2022294 [Mycena leptocephala]|nr:hypothetical protein B0H13DRAFT_2022294 [Mycena leptocephala]
MTLTTSLTLWTKTISCKPIASTKILQNLRCSSVLASIPVIWPRRFWDLHVPKTTWDYRARRHLQRGKKSDLKRARDWVSIPEKNLPEPWTCDWARWPLLENRLPVEAVLPMRYAIGEEPLLPIMFAYRQRQFADPGFEAEGIWRFDGVFSSVGAFIDKADWNRVEKIEARNDEDEGEICCSFCIQEHTPGFFRDGRPGRCQATIRTLWDMCRPPVMAAHPRLPPPRAVVVQVGNSRRDGRLVRRHWRRKCGGRSSVAVRADTRRVRAGDVCSSRIRARGRRPLSTQRGGNVLSVVQRRPLP